MSNNEEPTQKEIDAAMNEGEEERAYGLDLRVVVNGELYREWPQDLFIPPDALEVFLESFEGPLDLLLYLIRKENLNILDIPIAEITKQYMEYVELMRTVKLDLAAEYLLMAAMLAEIKSRMLLPRPEMDEDEEDPRSALVRRLQEYERYREAAVELDQLPRLERDLFVAKGRFVDPSPIVPEATVTLDQLAEAFAQVVANAARFQHLHVTREVLSVRERMTKILEQLRDQEFVRFESLFDPEEGRMGLVVTFIAILELVKDDMLTVVQNEPFAPLHIKPAA